MTEQELLDKKFGMRVARFLHRKAGQYIKTRYNALWKKQQDKKEYEWNSKFENQKCFPFTLDKDVLINIYKDTVLGRLIYDKNFENEEVLAIKQILKQGDIFFDIGANIGLFSLIASPIIGNDGRIYAFEPTPETYRRLKENISLNKFENIESRQIALSDKAGKTEFNVSEDGHDAWNSFVRLDRLEQNSHTIAVDTLTLDSFLIENSITKVKLIKIDVEGWELFVFKGAKDLLASPNAPVLMVEFTETNTFAAGYYCGELYDYIASFGYKWYRYNAENKSFVEEAKLLHYPYDNLFAIKDLANIG